MANVTIGQLSAATVINSADLFLTEQSGISKQVSVPVLASGLSTISGFKILRNYIDGLICSNGTDTEHDIDIGVGEASDSTNNYNLVLSSTITKQIDAIWAVGTNAGGLDTGTVASSLTYYIWLIKKDSDNSIDALFSLSDTSPTMPSGYTYKRKIMSIITDSSANIRNFKQFGDIVYYKDFVLDRSFSVLANTNRILTTISVPPSVVAIFNILAQAVSATRYLQVQSIYETDTAPSDTDNSLIIAFSTGAYACFDKEILADSNSQIAIRGSNTSLYVGIKTLGWIDDRGKNK